ncbi:MAG: radical SAM protein [Oscillospiraceae bacterium]
MKTLEKAKSGGILSKEETVELLSVENLSEQYYRLLSASNALSRKSFNKKGLIFAQIGLNNQPCSANCKFCSMASDNYLMNSNGCLSDEIILDTVKALSQTKAADIFLMTTADYPQELFLQKVALVKRELPDTRLVVNVGDFDLEYAIKLKQLGVFGAYHIVRLHEGIDTELPVEQRIKTLDAIKDAGLELYYCVEPIGPEHSYAEIAEEMLRARKYPVGVMAVMKRVCVAGSALFDKGEISSTELAKICAVANLVVKPTRAMGVHEPDSICLMSGANQIYAELGANPRDTADKTESGRGMSIDNAEVLLKNAAWNI